MVGIQSPFFFYFLKEGKWIIIEVIVQRRLTWGS